MLLECEPGPDVVFSGPMRDETRKGINRPGMPELYPALWIESETAGDLMISLAGVQSDTQAYSAKLVDISPVSYATNERSNDAAAIEVEATLADTPDPDDSGRRQFDRIATGFANRFRGARATLLMLSPNVTRDNALVLFRGVVDAFVKTGLVQWTIRLRTDDKALTYSEAPRIPYGRYFPRLEPDEEGTFAALIYGEHTGLAAGGKGGAIKLVYVDTGEDQDDGPFQWAVGLGRYPVSAVYLPEKIQDDEEEATGDNFVVVETTEYEVLYPVRGGKVFTVVSFAANPNEGEETDIEIRADVEGFGAIEDDGFTGDWRNPSWQLLHFLANFVFGDWRSGYFVNPADLPLDLGSFAFAAEYFDQFGYESARLLREPTSCETTVNEWAMNCNCKVFWTNEGKLAISPLDLRPPLDLYDTEFWARASEEAFSFGLPTDASQIVERITYSELYLDAEGKFMKTRSVSDISVPEKVRTTTDFRWSKAAI